MNEVNVREAAEGNYPSRWVMRNTLEGRQYALLIEYAGHGTEFVFQILTEDERAAHLHEWPDDPWDGFSFKLDGELLTLPFSVTEDVGDMEASLSQFTDDGWGWDGTIYEPDFDRLEKDPDDLRWIKMCRKGQRVASTGKVKRIVIGGGDK